MPFECPDINSMPPPNFCGCVPEPQLNIIKSDRLGNTYDMLGNFIGVLAVKNGFWIIKRTNRKRTKVSDKIRKQLEIYFNGK